MRIGLDAAVPLEGRIGVKVKERKLDECQEPVGRDLTLRGPEVYRTLLVLPSGAKENEMEYQYEVLSVDGKESQMVNPFGVAPRNTEEDFVWGANNIR